MFAPHATLFRFAATFALLAPAASASDWYVDAAYANCSSSTGSASQPFCTIGEAIAAAAGGDTIHVAPGTYDDQPLVDRSLTLIGTQGAAATLLTGQKSHQVMEFATGVTADVSGFTVQRGRSGSAGGAFIATGASVTFTDCVFRSNTSDDPMGEGGAISAYQAAVVLERCTFQDNVSYRDGGAIGVSGGSLTLLDCDVHDNLLGGFSMFALTGGAIRAKSGSVVDLERTRFSANGSSRTLGAYGCLGGAVCSLQSTVTIVECTFSDNTADVGRGGALEGDGFVVSDCLFERNHAVEGGAIEADQVTCVRSRFVDNEVVGIDDHGGIGGLGGALESREGADFTDCTFEGNVAHGIAYVGPGGGGAVSAYATPTAPSSFMRCRFAGNRAEGSVLNGGNGGALLVGDHVAFTDCEIVGNEASGSQVTDAGFGGGAVTSASTTLTFTRCTIAGNRADNVNGTAGAGGLGGGIYVQGACDLDHCVVAGNFAQAPSTQDVSGTVNSLGWNDFGDTNGATITGPGTGDLLDVDPLFADAANGDWRLDPTSPCIDSGDATLAPSGRDVAWNPRLLDGDLDGVLVLDRGAHEFSNVALAVTGSATPGGALTLDTTGTAGLPVVLVFGVATSELRVKKLGALFVDLSAPFLILPFGTIPNTQNVTIDPSLPVPLTVYLQAAALAPGAGNFGNLVTLEIE